MSRRAQENVIAAFLLLMFIGVFVLSLDYSPRARLVPLPIAALGIALTLAQLVWQNFRSLDELEVDMLEFISGDETGKLRSIGKAAGTEAEKHSGKNREATAFGIVGALLALCLVLGPLPAVLVFMAGYFAVSGLSSWATATAYAFLATTSLYLLFGRVLGVQFNRGLLSPYIGAYLHF